MESYDNIAKNIKYIRSQLDEISRSSGKKAPLLLAATKTIPAEIINYTARECGITDIGENRVQELLDKYEQLDRSRLNIHFIGSLQTNKVKYIIDKVTMIHSVDSIKLAQEKHGIVMDVLAEINIGREQNKGGILPEETEPFLRDISVLEGIKVRGLMTIAPNCINNINYYKYFEETYKIFIDISQKKLHNIDISVLSMGMSDSYMAAAECGSTIIRVGSAIFGARPTLKI